MRLRDRERVKERKKERKKKKENHKDSKSKDEIKDLYLEHLYSLMVLFLANPHSTNSIGIKQ